MEEPPVLDVRAAPARAPQPGIVALRPLSVREILTAAVGYVRTAPLLIFGVAAVFGTLTEVLWLAGTQRELGGELEATDPAVVGPLLGLLTESSRVAVSAVVVGILGEAVVRAVLGQRVRAGAALSGVLRHIPGLIGINVITGVLFGVLLAVGVGVPVAVALLVSEIGASVIAGLVVAAVLVGVGVLAVRLALVTPIYTLEGIGMFASLSRSWGLVRGHTVRVLFVLLLAGLLAIGVQLLVGLPFGLTGRLTEDPTAFALSPDQALLFVGGVLASTVTTPFVAGVVTLLYLDQRMRGEQFHTELADW